MNRLLLAALLLAALSVVSLGQTPNGIRLQQRQADGTGFKNIELDDPGQLSSWIWDEGTNLPRFRIDNVTATAPTAGDDTGDGYEVGSTWIDTAGGDIYVCVDASAAAAVWVDISAGAGALSIEDTAFGAGWDADLDGASKNSLYDYLVQLDADSNGTVDADELGGLGANVGTFLGTPSSANFAAAVTGETGTGALVFGTSPTIVTPTITQINSAGDLTLAPGGLDVLVTGDLIPSADSTYNLGQTGASWNLVRADSIFVDLIDGQGAVDIDYGSADITDHTFYTDGGVVLILNDATNTVALSMSGDRIFHDTNADGTKDAGEEFIDFSGGGGDLVDDTTPQLGGQLDVNGQAIGDGTDELLEFSETASAVNHLRVTNASTGSGPTLSAVGDDPNVDLNLLPTGTGKIKGAVDANTFSFPTAQFGSLRGDLSVFHDSLGDVRVMLNTRNVNQGLVIHGTFPLSWSPTTSANASTFGTGVYLQLRPDAAGILAQRNSTNAQALRVYNTWTDASNGEWFEADWQTTANTLLFGTNANGTGTVRDMHLQPNGGDLITGADILPDADSTRSMGADANRFLKIWADEQDVTTVNTAVINLLDGAGIQVEGNADALADDTYQAFKVISGRNAGEAITQWDLVYLNVADGEWHQADAGESTAAGKAWGVAATAGTDGNPLDVIVSGIIRNDGWTWSAGAVDLYVSDTPGEMTETAPSTTGDVVKIVARTLSDDEIYLDVTNHFIIAD